MKDIQQQMEDLVDESQAVEITTTIPTVIVESTDCGSIEGLRAFEEADFGDVPRARPNGGARNS